MKYLTLITCNDLVEANLIKGKLESNGIPCMLSNENTTVLLPYLNGMLGSGVQVLVHKEDAEKAAEIIHESEQIVVQDTDLVCPSCGGTDIKFGLGRNSFQKKLFILISALLAGAPFGFLQNKYYCSECGHSFKASRTASNST